MGVVVRVAGVAVLGVAGSMVIVDEVSNATT